MEEPSVIREFVLETSHALRTVEQDLLILERGPDAAALSRVFRALHSIKGSSGYLELASIERLSHQAETLLDLVRKGARPLTAAMNDVLLRCVDHLRELMALPDFGQNADVGETVAALESLIRGDEVPVTPVTVPPPEPSPPPVPVPLPLSVPGTNGHAPHPRYVSVPPAVTPVTPVVSSAPHAEPAAGDDDKMMRVRVKFLDDLLQLTGNMVMARNQLLARNGFADDPAFVTLSQCVTEVHKTIVRTRMNPIGTLFDRCERLVRDLCRQLDREVRLEISGRELQLDRSVLDSFADPLTHLIRNALDHGLESPAEREAAGKPRVGVLRLGAVERSGEVILSVEDDGRGIDLARIAESAVGKGLVSAARAPYLSRRATLDLLFQPGFSTRDEVTTLSGRGVGLDVVRTNIQKLGGTVEAEGSPGRGALFTARIPLAQALVSSSLISAIIVRCGEQRFAIPQTAVDEIIRLDSRTDLIRQINGRAICQLRDQVLPVVHLAEALGVPAAGEDDGRILIMMQFRDRLFGVRTGAILGVEEIVVRPLPELVRGVGLFSGHTVMGDGRVALILDANGIIQRQGLVFAGEDSDAHPSLAAGRNEGPQRLVVFNFAEDEHFAIPLEMVSYVEKIPTSAIKRVGAREFIQVNQRTMPLMRLDKVMSVGAMPACSDACVIIPARVSYPIAVLAGRSVRVVEVAEQYESRLSDGHGMLGTFTHGDDLVMLIDLYHLFERHSPEKFHTVSQERRPAHILLAEDSPFFQNLIRSYLENPPRHLTIAGNGRIAWEILQARPDEFDLLVTDIEMPEMDGFELVRKIRHDERLRSLPVIAVTSLASSQHIDRGMREGFDSYLVKIDKEQLLKTIARHLDRGVRRRPGLEGVPGKAEG